MALSINNLSNISMLVSRTELTAEQWGHLAESRRLALQSSLKNFSMQPLGEFGNYGEFIDFRFRALKLATQFVRADEGLSLNTPGVFEYNYNVTVEVTEFQDRDNERLQGPSCQFGHRRHFLWGLSRKAEWLSVQVDSYHTYSEVVAYDVDIKRVDFNTMAKAVQINPKQIILRLSKFVQHMLKRRRELLKEAEELEKFFDREDQVLHYVPDTVSGG